jgi:hypothetical protein
MLRSPLAPHSGTVATARIRVLLCDDHKLVRRGLHALLDADLTQEVVGGASSADEAVEIAVTLTPHVVAGRGETVSAPRKPGRSPHALAVPCRNEDDGAKGDHDHRVDGLRATPAPRVVDTPVRHGYPR